MKEIVEKVVEILKEKKLKIATAESITGGLIAESITDIPGSSEVFLGGVVAYSPFAKIKLLQINEKIIEKYGTVDPFIAEIMSKNVREIFEADIGISTTGVAGPDSIENKPIGLNYIGITLRNKYFVFENKFDGSRLIIREKVAEFLFNKLIEILRGG